MAKEIVILTSSAQRHEFLRRVFGLSDGIDVLRTYCESYGNPYFRLEWAKDEENETKIKHFKRRANSEYDFFSSFNRYTDDSSNPLTIPAGDINNEEYYEQIVDLDPDLLVAYGCSLIEDPLVSEYEGRFLNVHLGLSPYYRGTGTNFWPLVNREPEYVGATFMHIDEGVDTGEIIHQLRARIYEGDGPHQLGNRLIKDVAHVYPELVRKFDNLHPVEQPPVPDNENYYRKADYSDEATEKMYSNFEDGMVREYLEEKEERVKEVPIVKHPEIEDSELIPSIN